MYVYVGLREHLLRRRRQQGSPRPLRESKAERSCSLPLAVLPWIHLSKLPHVARAASSNANGT